MRAQQLTPALVEELDEVAANQEYQQDEEDNVEIDKENKDDIAGQVVTVAQLRQARLKEREQKDAQRGDSNDDPFPALAASLFVGRVVVPTVLHTTALLTTQQEKEQR